VKHDGPEIDMSEYESDAVLAMIEWFYVDNYPPCHATPASIEQHNRVHGLAKDLKANDLACRAEEDFRAALQSLVDGCPDKSNLSHVIFDEAIFNTEPESDLRLIVSDVLGKAYRTIFDKDNKTYEHLRSMIYENYPSLGLEILACMAKEKKTTGINVLQAEYPSMSFARLSDHDQLGHDLINESVVRHSSEPEDSEVDPDKDNQAPVSTTPSIGGSDDSTDS
jgi:hypothetical protein